MQDKWAQVCFCAAHSLSGFYWPHLKADHDWNNEQEFISTFCKTFFPPLLEKVWSLLDTVLSFAQPVWQLCLSPWLNAIVKFLPSVPCLSARLLSLTPDTLSLWDFGQVELWLLCLDLFQGFQRRNRNRCSQQICDCILWHSLSLVVSHMPLILS